MQRVTLAAVRATLSKAEPFSGYCFRCTSIPYANVRDALSGDGALHASGRFHLKGKFRIVYLGCDLHTAVEEYTQSARRSGFEVAHLLPLLGIGVEVTLSHLLNLTKPDVLTDLGIQASDLTSAVWGTGLREAPTQQLGRFASKAGFEAILVPSSVTSGKNLNFFPNCLLPGSSCRIVNQNTLPPVP